MSLARLLAAALAVGLAAGLAKASAGWMAVTRAWFHVLDLESAKQWVQLVSSATGWRMVKELEYLLLDFQAVRLRASLTVTLSMG